MHCRLRSAWAILSVSCALSGVRVENRAGESSAAAATLTEFDGPCQVSRVGATTIVVTPRFRVSGEVSREVALKIARTSERSRDELNRKWLPDVAPAAWATRCEIIVHDDLEHYLGAVGRAGASTVGSADVVRDTRGQLRRRIDLRGDCLDRAIAALPHELTHVVLADVFGDERPPLWADEGMAILADSPEKRRLHARDVHRAIASARHFEPAELLDHAAYPAADRWGTYYGQSAAAVAFLVERKSPPDFLRFLRIADERGYDAALREVYGLRDASALRAAWGPKMNTVSDTRGVIRQESGEAAR